MVTLTLVLACIIGFSIIMYVIMDGFDLGIGILLPFIHKQEDKVIALNSIAPIWDGNETWLVLGGTCLFAAFPKVYAAILPALYLPIIFFLIGLILRGVAFEFSFKATAYRWLCHWFFAFGSLLATFMQGVLLGQFIEGFSIINIKPLTLGLLSTTNLFSLVVGLALICGYALLGSTWLIIKTNGDLQEWCYRQAAKLMFMVICFIGLVSIWTPLMHRDIAVRWFSYPNIIFLSPVPLYLGITSIILFWAIARRHEYLPFLCSVGLFLLSFLGLTISIWPYIIPRILTIWDVVAPKESQVFILTGVLLLVPLILAYTAHAYWVFRGKVKVEEKFYQ